MAAQGRVSITLEAKVAKLERDMAKANKKVASGAKKMSRSFKNVSSTVVKLGGAIAVLGFGRLVKGAIDSTSALAKTAKAAGISAESLQEMRFAAEQSGVAATQLDDGMRRLTRRIGLAADGGGPAIKTFEQLGIEVRTASGEVKSSETIFDEAVDKIGKLGSAAEQAAAASALFGDDAGPKLALLLQQGAAGVAGLREEKRKLGIISDKEVAQAELTADAFNRVKTVVDNLVKTLALQLAPVLEGIGNFLAKGIPVAVKGSMAAITALRKAWLDIISTISKGLVKFYDLLGKLPGIVGETYQFAADDVRKFADITSDMSDQYAIDLQAQIDATKKLVVELNQGAIPAIESTAMSVENLGNKAEEAIDKIEIIRDTPLADPEFLENMGEDIDSTAESLEDFGNVGEEAANKVESAFGALFGFLPDGMRQVVQSLLSSFDEIGGLFGGGGSGGSSAGLLAGISTAVPLLAPLAALTEATGGGTSMLLGGIVGRVLDSLFGGGGVGNSELIFGAGAIGSRNRPGPGDRQADTGLGDVLLRGGGSAFRDEFGGPALQALTGTLDAISSILNPEEIAAAVVALEGSTFTVKPGDVEGGRFLLPVIDRILSTLDPKIQSLVAPFDGIEEKLNALQAARSMFQAMDFDAIQGANDLIESAGRGALESITSMGDELISLAEGFDGSIASMQQMTQGTMAFQQAVAQVLVAIEQAKQSVSATTASTIDALRFSQLDEGTGEGSQFEFLTRRAEELAAGLSTLVDPEAIARTVAQINALTSQAFNIASPEEQARLIENNIAFLESVEQVAQERLEALQVLVEDSFRDVMEETAGVIAQFTEDMGVVAGTFAGGAGSVVDASNRFGQSTDKFEAGVEKFVTTPILLEFESGSVGSR